MALARDGATRTAATFSSSANISLTTAGTGRLLVAHLSGSNSGSLSTIALSGGGLTWIKVVEEHSIASTWTSVWIAWASAQLTAQTITGTFNASTGVMLVVDAYTGAVDMTSKVAGTDYATGTAAPTATHVSVTLNTKADQSFLHATVASQGAVFSSVDANCSLIFDSGNNANEAIGRSDEPLLVGSYAVGVTYGAATNLSIAAMEILVAPTGGGANPDTGTRPVRGVGRHPNPTREFRSQQAFVVVPDPPAPVGGESSARRGPFRFRGPLGRFRTTLAYDAGVGTTYNDTLAEAANAVDALSATMTMPNSLAEAGSASDALSATAVFPNALSESGAAADALDTTAVFPNTLSESGSAADALSGTAVFPNTLSEAGAAADAETGLLATSNGVTEAVNSADSLASSGTWANLIAEAGGAADTVDSSAVFPNALAEAGIAGDAVAPGFVDVLSEAGFADDSLLADLVLGASPGPIGGGFVFYHRPLPKKPDATPVPAVVHEVGLLEAVAAMDALGASMQGTALLDEPVSARASVASRAAFRAAVAEHGHADDELRGGFVFDVEMQEGVTASVLAGKRAIAIGEEDFVRLLLGETGKAKKTVQSLDRDRLAVVHARTAVHDIARAFLKQLGAEVAAAARRMRKAAGDEKDDPAVAAAEADYDPLRDGVEPHLRDLAQDAGKLGLQQVGVSGADLDRLLSQVNERAVSWAEDRSGELVTQVNETTRDRVRDLVARAEEEGWSNDQLADELAGDGVFGDARAELIARTETAFADVQGNLIGWKESGVVEGKRWLLSDGACDICLEFDGLEVGLDEEFPEGDPPAHPNCRCDVLPVLAEEEE